jgi:hypothetical protein
MTPTAARPAGAGRAGPDTAQSSPTDAVRGPPGFSRRLGRGPEASGAGRQSGRRSHRRPDRPDAARSRAVGRGRPPAGDGGPPSRARLRAPARPVGEGPPRRRGVRLLCKVLGGEPAPARPVRRGGGGGHALRPLRPDRAGARVREGGDPRPAASRRVGVGWDGSRHEGAEGQRRGRGPGAGGPVRVVRVVQATTRHEGHPRRPRCRQPVRQGARSQRGPLPSLRPLGRGDRRRGGRVLRRADRAPGRPGHPRPAYRRDRHGGRRVLRHGAPGPPRGRPPGPLPRAVRPPPRRRLRRHPAGGRRAGGARPASADPVAHAPAELAERPGMAAPCVSSASTPAYSARATGRRPTRR